MELLTMLLEDFHPGKYNRTVPAGAFTSSNTNIVVNPETSRLYVVLSDYKIHDVHCVARINGELSKINYNYFMRNHDNEYLKKKDVDVIHTAEQLLAFFSETCSLPSYAKKILDELLEYAELDISNICLPKTSFGNTIIDDAHGDAFELIHRITNNVYGYLEDLSSMQYLTQVQFAVSEDAVYMVMKPATYDSITGRIRSLGHPRIFVTIEDFMKMNHTTHPGKQYEFLFDNIRNDLNVFRDDSKKVLSLILNMLSLFRKADTHIPLYDYTTNRHYIPSGVSIRDGLLYMECNAVEINPMGRLSHHSIDDTMYNEIDPSYNDDRLSGIYIPIPMFLTMPVISSDSEDNIAVIENIEQMRQLLLEYIDIDNIEEYKMDDCDKIEFNKETCMSLMYSIGDADYTKYEFDITNRTIGRVEFAYDLFNKSIVLKFLLETRYIELNDEGRYTGTGGMITLPIIEANDNVEFIMPIKDILTMQPTIVQDVVVNDTVMTIAVKKMIAIQDKINAVKASATDTM